MSPWEEKINALILTINLPYDLTWGEYNGQIVMPLDTETYGCLLFSPEFQRSYGIKFKIYAQPEQIFTLIQHKIGHFLEVLGRKAN